MKIAAVADVKAHLSAYVDECENEGPVIITRNGKAPVLLAPYLVTEIFQGNDQRLRNVLVEKDFH